MRAAPRHPMRTRSICSSLPGPPDRADRRAYRFLALADVCGAALMVTGNPSIVVEGLVRRCGPVVALDGIDLEVEAKSIFALLGPNGAGKTTAVRILTTILRPDSGRAQV